MAVKYQAFFVACCSIVLLTCEHAGTSAAPQPNCANPAPGEVACMAILVKPNDVETVQAVVPMGLTPADLHKAYHIPDGGHGQTVALIDAYDDPNAESDLGVYRAKFGLQPCTAANGCFHKVAEDGTSNYPAPSMAWSGETSLDIEMASAVCPACNILLIEANSAALTDMALSVNRAVSLHANTVGNSYGGREFPQETAFEANYDHPGVIMTASAGDSGFGAQFPAVSRYVVAVGGTELRPDVTMSRGFSETAWTGTGSGCSAYEPKPGWQHDKTCANRVSNDIAFVASPSTPVAVYESFCTKPLCGWIKYAGTSIGAPAMAALYAVAGNAQKLSAAQSLYSAKPNDLYDIAAGTNGICPAKPLCNALPGYDAPSGNGSPNGIAAL